MGEFQADAVFEGGGVKAIGLAGALVAAESKGYRWVNVAGSSSGALLAALVAAGYRGEEIAGLLFGLDLARFRDPGPWRRVPLAGALLAVTIEKGLYRGDALERWVAERLAARGVRTFGDLLLPEEKDPRFRFRLQVIATDISRGRLLILPQDIAAYGAVPEELPVARAVRMSASLPFFYRPVTVSWRRSGNARTSYVVDGGVLSNFPVWLFDVEGAPPWPTIGFKLVEPGEGRPQRVRGPVSLAWAIVSTMLEAHDARYIEDQDFVRTIPIPTLGVRTTDFDLRPEKQRELFEAGVKAAEEFFRTWDFPTYVARYRLKRPPGRRKALGA